MSKTVDGHVILEGSGDWGFEVIIDGDDLVMRNVKATSFGTDDPDDGGIAASNFLTQTYGPRVPVFSLPMAIAHVPYMAGCPIPDVRPGHSWGNPRMLEQGTWSQMNWCKIRVYSHTTKKECTGPVCELGPAKDTHNPRAVDCSTAAVRALGYEGDVNNFEDTVDVRIFGGAKYVK